MNVNRLSAMLLALLNALFSVYLNLKKGFEAEKISSFIPLKF